MCVCVCVCVCVSACVRGSVCVCIQADNPTMASRKRPRRSLSLAGDGEDGANSADPSTSASAVALGSGASAAGKDDAAAAAAAAATAAVRKRSRASVAAANAEAAAAAAAAASFAEEQAAMFENLDEEKEYSNWFPRQAGFNTLSRSQINKDIRDLNASAHPAPVESEDEELDGSMYMLFDAGLGSRVSSSSSSSSGLSSSSRSHQRAAQSGGVKQEAGAGHAQATHDSAARPPPKTLGRHATPEVLRDVWSNELLYYRWRIKKRSLEMHEVLAERRHAWETYVALRSTLIGEIRRLNQQRDEHAHVLQQLQRCVCACLLQREPCWLSRCCVCVWIGLERPRPPSPLGLLGWALLGIDFEAAFLDYQVQRFVRQDHQHLRVADQGCAARGQSQ